MEQDSAVPPPEPPAPADGPVEPRPPSRSGGVLKGVGIVATGLVAGAVGIALLQAPHGTTSAASTTPVQQGAAQGGPPGGFGPGGPGAGVPGGSRAVGTIASVGATSITVRALDGSTTVVTVSSATQIVRNGVPASLAALRSGDQVVARLAPSGTGTVASRIMAGTFARRGGGGPAPAQPGTGTPSNT